MLAVLKRGEQVEAALERIAVARPERPLELRVARHTPSRSVLAQENRLVGLLEATSRLVNQYIESSCKRLQRSPAGILTQFL